MDNKQFGLFLNKLRKEKGLTQQELADKLHVTRQAVSKWESGSGYPDVSMLTSIASELNVSVDELMNAKKDSNSKSNKYNKYILIIVSIVLIISCILFISYLNRDKTPKMFKTIINDIYNGTNEVKVEDYNHNNVTEEFKEIYQDYYDNKNYYYIFTNCAGKYVFNGRFDIDE